MKKILTLVFALTMVGAIAQPGWNWPEDPDQKSVAMEKQAFYKVSMGLENWSNAFNALKWLYENNADLNPSIYIDGAKVMENMLEGDIAKERVAVLEDSLLWTFDMRTKYFDKDASVSDRKAYTAFKLYYKEPSKFPLLAELYEEAYQMNGAKLSSFNITPYMTLAKYYYQTKPDEMTAEKVLEVHTRLSEIIDAKIAQGGNPTKYNKEQDKIDALLSSIEGLLSCEFIENQLVPKFEASPGDLNLAKKIFSYSLKAKCSDQPYFTKAGDVLYENEPTFQLAIALANKYKAADDYDKAVQYFESALELSTDNEGKYDAHVGLATVYASQGNKVKSRSMAYEALSVKPGAAEPYNIIGNLYFTSYQSCKEGESKVKDRAVFIAAYEMYQKAGNTAQMQASQEQFPSVEEIFNAGYEKGDKITVDCWINKSVSLQTRD
jgi:tetratricopeptide (TPR) repeat protein